MARPYKHPVDDLIATAEETERILCRSHQIQLKSAKDSPYWEEMAAESYLQLLECRKRIKSLIESRERALGPRKDESN